VASRVVFLEDYDLHLAPRLIGGCDVWLNLPRPPLEASGTSGMKSVVNGGLQLSVLDGWWEEAFDDEVGWAIRTPEADPGAQDAHDAAALFDLLEHAVAPAFYDRDADGVPVAWTRRVRASMQRLVPRFSSHRMLRDYERTLYGAG
jgi:starch phosphorylase